MIEEIQFEQYLERFINILQNNLFAWSNLIELIIFVFLILGAQFISKKIYDSVDELLDKIEALKKHKKTRIVERLLFPVTLLILLGIYYIIAAAFGLSTVVISIFSNLVTAWLIVKVIALFFPKTRMFRFTSAVIWIIAALRILNIYDETLAFLDSIAFTSGNLRISLLLIIKVIILFSILFWLAGKISILINKRLEKSEDLTPSVKVLLNKIARFLIYTSAFLFTLSAVGIDLSAFAFLGGAIGVGLGFGLQKIVSNFISGIIILADKSIKPGDVVEIGKVYGWVRKLDTRFVSVVTRSGKEFLIPNEDFITKQVINWSYSDELVRVEADVGVSYNSDLREVQELMMEAVKDHDRILSSPDPKVILIGFGDNSVDFELRFWISDPRNGIQNIRSEVLLSIWDEFKEAEIGIPFPQRDLYLKSVPEGFAENIKGENAKEAENIKGKSSKKGNDAKKAGNIKENDEEKEENIKGKE